MSETEEIITRIQQTISKAEEIIRRWGIDDAPAVSKNTPAPNTIEWVEAETAARLRMVERLQADRGCVSVANPMNLPAHESDYVDDLPSDQSIVSGHTERALRNVDARNSRIAKREADVSFADESLGFQSGRIQGTDDMGQLDQGFAALGELERGNRK